MKASRYDVGIDEMLEREAMRKDAILCGRIVRHRSYARELVVRSPEELDRSLLALCAG